MPETEVDLKTVVSGFSDVMRESYNSETGTGRLYLQNKRMLRMIGDPPPTVKLVLD